MGLTIEDSASARPAAGAAEPDGFEQVFHGEWGRIVALVFRVVGDRARAEDLALDAFVELWRNPPRPGGSVAGWLSRVAWRLGLNEIRARGRRARHEGEAAREAARLGESQDPLREAERARVRATLARLDERTRQVLLLHHSGYTYREIAGAVGVKASSVGTLLARAERAFVDAHAKGAAHAASR